MKHDYEAAERISALLDGESTTPAEDTALVQSDAAAAEQHRQYQEIRRLMGSLPFPEPSPHFVEDTLARLPHKRGHYYRNVYLPLAVAAVLLLAVSVFLYQYQPFMTPESAEITQPMVADAAPTLIHLDVPEDELWLLLPDTSTSSELEQTLALFEDIPEETLLIALAEMAFDPNVSPYTTSDMAILEEEALFGDASDSLADVFILLENLNHAELDALNRVLRDALAEA